jgi:hypothetical protein
MEIFLMHCQKMKKKSKRKIKFFIVFYYNFNSELIEKWTKYNKSNLMIWKFIYKNIFVGEIYK